MTYHIRGVLLATHHYFPGRDIAELEHDEVRVAARIVALTPQRAAVEAAYASTLPYSSWRWREPPEVEESTDEQP
jgi:hypothetical protein